MRITRRILAISAILALAACSGCKITIGIKDPDVIAPFNVAQWLEVEANAMAFEYIDVSLYPDIWDRGVEPTGSFAASEADKENILYLLAGVSFAPLQAPAVFAVDFAFAMNEPFVFFGFDGEGLFVREPSARGTGYAEYKALFEDYGELSDLREYIGKMRLAQAAPDEGFIAGGYTEDRDVTPEDLEIFYKALEGLTGVAYEPSKVATQVVAGMNYRFTATATPVIPDPEPYMARVTIFAPLAGEPELVEIETMP